VQISKEKGAQVASEIQAAVNEILQRHGLATPRIKWAYGEWFKFTVEANAVEMTNGVNAASPQAQYYMKFGWSMYGRELTAPLGTAFQVDGRLLRFAGVEPKRRKFPIMAFDVKNNVNVFLTEEIIAVINAAASNA